MTLLGFLITVYVVSCLIAAQSIILLPGLALVTDVELKYKNIAKIKVFFWVFTPAFNTSVAIGSLVALFYASHTWWERIKSKYNHD